MSLSTVQPFEDRSASFMESRGFSMVTQWRSATGPNSEVTKTSRPEILAKSNESEHSDCFVSEPSEKIPAAKTASTQNKVSARTPASSDAIEAVFERAPEATREEFAKTQRRTKQTFAQIQSIGRNDLPTRVVPRVDDTVWLAPRTPTDAVIVNLH